MMKSVFSRIENPDVPGFEKELRPPTVPPSSISVNPSEPVPNSMGASYMASNMVNSMYQSMPGNPYYAPIQPQANQPWWIPSEADSEVYSQWYESAYKAAVQASQVKSVAPPIPKLKLKAPKRKAEPVDPKKDAERVANAQKELSSLMKPLKCDLCNAVMNSTLQSKLHYEGKPHQKKVSMFLNQSAKKPKVEEAVVSSTTSSSADASVYCELCKTWFTSATDANQHYAGKKHQKVAHGKGKAKHPPPKPRPSHTYEDPTGRYGIGAAFQYQAPPPPPPQQLQPPIVTESFALAPLIVPAIGPKQLECHVCGISVNRQEHLDTHLRGTKHLKMLKQRGLVVPSADEFKPGHIDYSSHRTPSGQYYCAPCNVSLNSEAMFAQHIESKKHRNQVNPKSPPPPPTPAKNPAKVNKKIAK